jgi:uncharacterized protein involved in response to NO
MAVPILPFVVLASLGHSGHPLRDSWPQCLVSFILLVFAPLALFARFAGKRSDRDKT